MAAAGALGIVSPSIGQHLSPTMKSHYLIRITTLYGAFAAAAQAVSIFGIGIDNNFYLFDSSSPGTVVQVGASGAASSLVDLDVHGADGRLYGMAANGAVSSIHTGNGQLTAAYSPLTPYGAAVTAFDHNPLADRVRVVAGNLNYRIVPNVVTPPQAPGTIGAVTTDGTFSFFDASGMLSRTGLTVLGAGYTNPVDNPSSTLLYTLTSDGFLNSHSSPAGSFGNGNAVGSVGLGFIPVGSGFDIGVDGFGYGYDGMNLRQINLATGTSISLGQVGVGLRSLAVIPEPSSALLTAVASLGVLRRRRRA